MRNKLLIGLILFIGLQANAQKSEVLSVTTKDRIFEGIIDDNYPITMYLKVVKRSVNSGYVQSVAGWYFYNKVGTSIPLAGLIGPGVHLVVSEDPEVLKGIQNFEYVANGDTMLLDNRVSSVVDNMALIKNMMERFTMDYDGDKILGTWQSNDKNLKIELFADEYRVADTRNYLRHPNGEYFDLSYLGFPDWASIEVEASANNGRNVILDCYFQANLNYMGRCGAAENKGKVGLIFNEKYELVKSSFVIFEDCYRDIYTFNEEQISETVTKYEIEHFENSDDPQYVYCTVDLEKATLRKE
ncbi:MAG: hypothetical protein R8G66_33310 [Cytophagales bacterium]|nr:hypothetical protein [Cytophagales bacterium]